MDATHATQSGEALAQWVDGVSKTRRITINGALHHVAAGEVSYDQIFALSKGPKTDVRPGLSIAYTGPRNGDAQRSGILSFGQSVPVESGMKFDAVFTGNA